VLHVIGAIDPVVLEYIYFGLDITEYVLIAIALGVDVATFPSGEGILIAGGVRVGTAYSKPKLKDLSKSAGKRSDPKRPSKFRKKTVQDAWDDAAPGSKLGPKACPTCNKDADVAPGQGHRDWDVDHQPKWKDRDLSGMDRKQILDEFNKDVRLRCPSCNRADNR